VLTAVLVVPIFSQAPDTAPRLLLTPQRLRRLQRDRERQTVRWQHFESRVKSVPDSPERGFELALYYAISRDDSLGKQAIDWARTHPCETRQVALVRDWCGPLITAESGTHLDSTACPKGYARSDSDAASRDVLFREIESGQDTAASIKNAWPAMLARLRSGAFDNAGELYAACEYLMTVKSTERTDLRQDAPQFFSQLPEALLLSLRPVQLEHPEWLMHVAALSLVALDPNLESSQFLQSWVLEDGQTLNDGPGVGYELLWADPYLPGVSYQNRDPWLYQPGERLLARADWSPQSCWVNIDERGVRAENCAPGWQDKPATFGRLTLLPLTLKCLEVPEIKTNESVVLTRMTAGQKLRYQIDKKPVTTEADSLGMWRAPSNAQGKVCLLK